MQNLIARIDIALMWSFEVLVRRAWNVPLWVLFFFFLNFFGILSSRLFT